MDKIRSMFSMKNLVSMDHIVSNLYISSAEEARNKILLKENKIRNILVAGQGLIEHYPNEFGYQSITIQDLPHIDLLYYLLPSFKYIEGCKGNVLVHCMAGCSRSVSIVTAYLMIKMR